MYVPIIARVESLPPLPESILELEKLFAQGNPDIDDLVQVIMLDPSLTADVLSKVNAPLYGFSQKIVSILQAITLFGSTQIRSIILASSIQKSFDIDLSPYGITTSDFSKISTMQSELLFQWYMGVNIDMARDITPIAFLMEIGKILIAKDILQREKEKSFLEELNEYEDLAQLENIYTMMSTAEINVLIFKQLHLNKSFYESMKYIDNERGIPLEMQETVKALQVVRAAVNIREQLTEESINKAMDMLEKNSLNVDTFQRALKRVKRKYLEE